MNKLKTLLYKKDAKIENIKENQLNNEPVKFKVRNLKKKDMPQVLAIYKDLNWHTSPDYFQMWHQIDPNSFKVAVTNKDVVLGYGCALRLHQDYCFFGCYIVKKEFRGMGIGKKVFDVCMDHIGTRNASLNGMPETVSMYQTKTDFTCLEEEYQVQENETLEDEIHPDNLIDDLPDDVIIVTYHPSYLPIILDYDYDICGYNRKVFLKLSFKAKESLTLVAFQRGLCVGFGIIKRSILNVPFLAPLYADDPVVAESLMKRLMMAYPLKKGFYMATFTNNIAATNLIKKIGCPTSYKLPRLSKSKKNFKVPIHKVYAHFDINASNV